MPADSHVRLDPQCERPTGFRIVLLSSSPPAKLDHLLRRLAVDLPEIQVGGILHAAGRRQLPWGQRLRYWGRSLLDRRGRRYLLQCAAQQLGRQAARLGDSLLRWVHACPRHPNGPPLSLVALAQSCRAAGIPFHTTQECSAEAALAFVRGIDADLGVGDGTAGFLPELFAVPKHGSIHIHKHKLPDYPEDGPPGLWALRDGRQETTVTVHRLPERAAAVAVLGERTFGIDPLDTLASISLKADLLAIDLLIEVLHAESQGGSLTTPRLVPAPVPREVEPQRLLALQQAVHAQRPPRWPRAARPAHKLLLRSLLYPVLCFRNRRRRRHRTFPVIILFHHLITDKPKTLGLPTAAFARQVRYLKKHYRIAALGEALQELRRGCVPVPTVVLTFDDGYAENFLGLRAVAEAENIPISHFVCTQHVTDGSGFAHDLARAELGFPALSWDQLRYLDRHGVTIGSHTRTHLACAGTDPAILLDEVVGSAADLSQVLGHPVDYFSFPKGYRHNMSVPAVALAQQTYPFIFSAYGGTNQGPVVPPCEVYRCSHPDSLWELELLLQSVLEFHQAQRPAATTNDARDWAVQRGRGATPVDVGTSGRVELMKKEAT